MEQDKKEYLNVIQYINKYDRFILKTAYNIKRNCPKLEVEDIKQQLILTLLLNYKSYDEEKSASCHTYFSTIIVNSASNIIKKYSLVKNKVYAESVSLDAYISENNENNTFLSFVKESEEDYSNPLVYLKTKETLNYLDTVFDELSDTEKDIFVMFLNGSPIVDIANKYNKSKKTIYNILAVIKNKIKDFEF